MEDKKKYYRAIDIQREFKISYPTIWRWIREGKFPKPDVKVGRIRRWSEETIREWMESNQDASE